MLNANRQSSLSVVEFPVWRSLLPAANIKAAQLLILVHHLTLYTALYHITVHCCASSGVLTRRLQQDTTRGHALPGDTPARQYAAAGPARPDTRQEKPSRPQDTRATSYTSQKIHGGHGTPRWPARLPVCLPCMLFHPCHYCRPEIFHGATLHAETLSHAVAAQNTPLYRCPQ